ncbi:MAG: tetraacyldisaccharide 4'-kinase, partial [Hyphomicrobium sp.]
VRLDEPSWWYGGAEDVRQRALMPLSRLYGWIAERRYVRGTPYRSRLPVICVGNFTAGGTGKTPLSIHIARLLIARGEKPVFLTRGYGGRTSGPAWVDHTGNAVRRFGDEPMLLAAVAPTLVARDRRAGIITIERDRRAPSVVIMDDGLQNPAVAKDLSIALVDGRRASATAR